MLRQLAHQPFRRSVQSLEETLEFVVAHHVDDRVVLLWQQSLAEHDLDPGILAEEFARSLEYTAGLPEQLDAMREGLRNFHRAAVVPEFRVIPPGHVEIGLADATVREHLHQAYDAALNEMDTG